MTSVQWHHALTPAVQQANALYTALLDPHVEEYEATEEELAQEYRARLAAREEEESTDEQLVKILSQLEPRAQKAAEKQRKLEQAQQQHQMFTYQKGRDKTLAQAKKRTDSIAVEQVMNTLVLTEKPLLSVNQRIQELRNDSVLYESFKKAVSDKHLNLIRDHKVKAGRDFVAENKYTVFEEYNMPQQKANHTVKVAKTEQHHIAVLQRREITNQSIIVNLSSKQPTIYQFEERAWAARRWLCILNAANAFFKFDELSTVLRGTSKVVQHRAVYILQRRFMPIVQAKIKQKRDHCIYVMKKYWHTMYPRYLERRVRKATDLVKLWLETDYPYNRLLHVKWACARVRVVRNSLRLFIKRRRFQVMLLNMQWETAEADAVKQHAHDQLVRLRQDVATRYNHMLKSGKIDPRQDEMLSEKQLEQKRNYLINSSKAVRTTEKVSLSLIKHNAEIKKSGNVGPRFHQLGDTSMRLDQNDAMEQEERTPRTIMAIMAAHTLPDIGLQRFAEELRLFQHHRIQHTPFHMKRLLLTAELLRMRTEYTELQQKYKQYLHELQYNQQVLRARRLLGNKKLDLPQSMQPKESMEDVSRPSTTSTEGPPTGLELDVTPVPRPVWSIIIPPRRMRALILKGLDLAEEERRIIFHLTVEGRKHEIKRAMDGLRKQLLHVDILDVQFKASSYTSLNKEEAMKKHKQTLQSEKTRDVNGNNKNKSDKVQLSKPAAITLMSPTLAEGNAGTKSSGQQDRIEATPSSLAKHSHSMAGVSDNEQQQQHHNNNVHTPNTILQGMTIPENYTSIPTPKRGRKSSIVSTSSVESNHSGNSGHFPLNVPSPKVTSNNRGPPDPEHFVIELCAPLPPQPQPNVADPCDIAVPSTIDNNASIDQDTLMHFPPPPTERKKWRRKKKRTQEDSGWIYTDTTINHDSTETLQRDIYTAGGGKGRKEYNNNKQCNSNTDRFIGPFRSTSPSKNKYNTPYNGGSQQTTPQSKHESGTNQFPPSPPTHSSDHVWNALGEIPSAFKLRPNRTTDVSSPSPPPNHLYKFKYSKTYHNQDGEAGITENSSSLFVSGERKAETNAGGGTSTAQSPYKEKGKDPLAFTPKINTKRKPPRGGTRQAAGSAPVTTKDYHRALKQYIKDSLVVDDDAVPVNTLEGQSYYSYAGRVRPPTVTGKPKRTELNVHKCKGRNTAAYIVQSLCKPVAVHEDALNTTLGSDKGKDDSRLLPATIHLQLPAVGQLAS